MKAATIRMIRTLFILFFVVIYGGSASAQNCSIAPEAIVPLRSPDIGAFNVWSGVHGDEDTDDRYVDGAVLPNSHMFLAGETLSAADSVPKLVLSEVDRRGRIVWRKEHDVPALKMVVKVLPYKNDYIVLGNKKNAAWVGVFDAQGALKSQRVHKHGGSKANGGSLEAYDIIMRPKGGFLMAVRVQPNAKEKKGHASLYRLNSKGQFVSKRSYLFGHDNRIQSLAVMDDGSIMGAGYLTQANGGRRQGWLIRLEDGGNIVWQRQYPRGSHAEFYKVQAYGEGGSVVMSGAAIPAARGGSDNKAGWIMVVDGEDSNIIWQRYFTGGYDYVARDFLVHADRDGLLSLLLDADPSKAGEGKDFVQLVTLNPRGVMLSSAEHFNAQGADAFSMIEGPSQNRIIIGASDVAYTIEGNDAKGDNGAQDVIKRSREGWVIAAPAADDYSDPCRPKPARQL